MQESPVTLEGLFLKLMKDYHINIFHSERHNGYIADIPDLPQCLALGTTPAEALSKVEEVRDKWLQKAAKLGSEVPGPRYQPDIYVGKDFALPTPAQATLPQLSYDETLEYIANCIARREIILFLGSAIHVPPDDKSAFNYPAEKAPPIGANLSKHLAEKGEYHAQDWWNLPRVSQHFESEKGRFRLVEEIKSAVHTGREPSPMLRLLSDLEFPLVITTNYDQLYERVLDQKAEEEGLPQRNYDIGIYNKVTVDEQMNPIYTTDCANKPDPKRPFILKIHGDVCQPQSIVITDEDYIQFVLRMSDSKPFHPFGENVLAYLRKWPTLFIGYSLIDYNLRLLFQTLRWKKDAALIPPNFSVDKKPDELILDVWQKQRRYVQFLVLNLWDFIPRLHGLVSGSIPKVPAENADPS